MASNKRSNESEKIKKKIFKLVGDYHSARFESEEFIPGESYVQNSGKMFGIEELKNGIESILDGWWTDGRFAESFESSLRNYLKTRSVHLVNSGSSANLLAVYSLTSKELGERRIKEGDEVISVAAAFPTTVNPIVLSGAVPVFLDIEDLNSGQYNIDVSRLEEAVSDRTKAIFLAHTLGNPFNVDAILETAKKHNLYVIEDCCDALGSEYSGKKVSSFGDIATFSFYPAHHITTGEGGAVATKNTLLSRLIKSWRNWGRDCWCDSGKDNTCGKRFEWKLGDLPRGYDHKNIYSKLGFNLKITDMQASIGLAQLEKVGEFGKIRKENFKSIYKTLERYEDKIILPQSLPESNPSWFGFPISVREDAGFSRDEFTQYLNSCRIGFRPLFSGNITRHPSFKGVKYRVVGTLRNTDATMNQTFWIGIQPNITEEKKEYVIKVLNNYLDR